MATRSQVIPWLHVNIAPVYLNFNDVDVEAIPLAEVVAKIQSVKDKVNTAKETSATPFNDTSSSPTPVVAASPPAFDWRRMSANGMPGKIDAFLYIKGWFYDKGRADALIVTVG
ncbi:hypothetical protein NX059_004544 [Plenodomus lindquistii]|nr:hypothetical protein NX059_004544 [Plenodomus lindquistii]